MAARRGWLVRLLSVLALCLSSFSGAADNLGRAQQLLSSLSDTATTARFAQVAREFGPVIDEVRTGASSIKQLHGLRDITNKFRDKTSARLRAAEREAGDSEGALEALYRSSAWDDLSFALAAFPYWGAWIDLEIAKNIKDPGERAPWIWKAKKGFRSTSVQIFRPSLVYGGWLGLGYIASAEKKYDQALSIFESLKNALEVEPDNPLYKVVSLELRLLQAREGQVDSSGVATSGKVDDNEAQLLRLEAFALLEKYRTSQEGGREAAARLKKLVRSGYVDMDFVAQVVNYRAEIAAFDVGPWTHLAAAEYAFEYGHFFDSVQKYKRFFAGVGNIPGVDLSRYRYRHALANYKAKLYDDAARIAGSLGRRANLDPEIKKASIKLAYAALSSRPGRGSRADQRALQDAAQRFVSAYPNDPGADGARLSIAQLTKDTQQAFYMLDNVKKPKKFQGGIEQTKFYLMARDFANALRKGDQKTLAPIANRGIAAFKGLPSAERQKADSLAIVLQMRALVDQNPDKVLAAIDKMESSLKLSITAREAMLWARIKCYERLGNYDKMMDYLSSIARGEPEGWQMEQIYPAVRALPDEQNRLNVVRAMLPGLSKMPSMERRFRIMEIDAMLATAQYEAAYDAAKDFLEKYPRAGDGWRVLAVAAGKTGKPFEADSAWKTITERADPRRELWWEGMISRAEIRSASTRPKAACQILEEISARKSQMPAGFSTKVEEITRAVNSKSKCGVKAS
ncbi:MAG: hypothetical protein ACU84Q_09730 [Gammaproteobacteria bacterium]